MPDRNWWQEIPSGTLLELRKRALARLGRQFPTLSNSQREDIVQQAFVSMFQRRQSIQPDDDGLFRYMTKCMRNDAIDLRRAKTRDAKAQDKIIQSQKLPSSSPKEANSGLTAEENQEIWEIYCALSDLERLVLWSHAVDGKSIRSVSGELGISWHRAMSITVRTMAKMRAQLLD